ncbi:hypothetical protein ACIRD2_23010 [Streptomyces sp. NPDC093595]|uniref:hypothetical protein n=1 Tax=Streptomyces sp. NPDC093595 TaxID=3366045 RepID=UPI0037FB3A0B
MQRDDMPEPVERRLSTEDLARPRDTGPGEGGGTAMTEPAPEPDSEPVWEPASAPEPEPGAGPETGRGAAPEPEPGPGAGDAAGSDVPAYPGESTPTATAGRADSDQQEDAPQLLASDDQDRFRERWQSIQNEFVDDPREAVHKADALVADVMQQLASNFADHKKDLEGQWNRGEEANTEDLRMALRKYRSFFNRLLTT